MRTETPDTVVHTDGPWMTTGASWEHRVARDPAGRCGVLCRDRIYVGRREAAGCRVSVVDEHGAAPLAAREPQPLTSFSWGRPGRSASDLAWAILFDCTRDGVLAADWCLEFSVDVVQQLPRASFDLPARDVLAWLESDNPARPVIVSAGVMG